MTEIFQVVTVPASVIAALGATGVPVGLYSLTLNSDGSLTLNVTVIGTPPGPPI